MSTAQAIRASINRRMLDALNTQRDMSMDSLVQLKRGGGGVGNEIAMRRKAGDDGSVPELMAMVGQKMSNAERRVTFSGGQVQFSDVEADK